VIDGFVIHVRRVTSDVRAFQPGAPHAGAIINNLDNALTSAGQNAQLATPWYFDQVLPFDVTLFGANEYGAMCAAKGVKTEFSGLSRNRNPSEPSTASERRGHASNQLILSGKW